MCRQRSHLPRGASSGGHHPTRYVVRANRGSAHGCQQGQRWCGGPPGRTTYALAVVQRARLAL
jgi:hypothetical protein